MPAAFGARNEVRYTWIVFQENPLPHWWNGFLRPGWRHCWAFQEVYCGPPGLLTPRYAAKLELLSARLDTDVWWAPPEEVAEAFLAAGVTDIVRVRARLAPAAPVIPYGLLTCVSLVKALLGLRGWRIWTPAQLHRALLARGAVSLRGRHADGKRAGEPVRGQAEEGEAGSDHPGEPAPAGGAADAAGG